MSRINLNYVNRQTNWGVNPRTEHSILDSVTSSLSETLIGEGPVLMVLVL